MTVIQFDFPEDRTFFEELLCTDGETISQYQRLFDFRDPSLKRKEFNRQRPALLQILTDRQGLNCALNFEDICDLQSGLNIDHIIPLSTNKLNKELRGLIPEKGKKVKSQSFGSNNLENLILTCKNCNNHKKHRLLENLKLRALIKNTLPNNG